MLNNFRATRLLPFIALVPLTACGGDGETERDSTVGGPATTAGGSFVNPAPTMTAGNPGPAPTNPVSNPPVTQPPVNGVPVAGELQGFRSTTVTADDAKAAYETWKGLFVEQCGDGLARVKFDNPEETVSEGIAYGMLLAAYNQDQQTLDDLWQYYKNNRGQTGVMHWHRGGCAGNKVRDVGDGGASDAELDAAMALIKAACQWSGGRHDYWSDVRELLAAVRNHETARTSDGLLVLKPGDRFGGEDCVNASYFAPGYYRVFAAVEPEHQDTWLKLADDSYTVLQRMANPQTGLVPNWSDAAGNSPPSGCNWYDNPEQYTYDAARTPWRLAIDYQWFGTPAAKELADKMTNFVVAPEGDQGGWFGAGGIDQVIDGYQLNGQKSGRWKNAVFTGAFAVGAAVHSQERVDEFSQAMTRSDRKRYFPATLYPIYMLAVTGMFDAACRPQ